jgi:hypothetical protein
MWVCLNKAFFSIVHKECKPDELLVRARRPGDIESVFPDAVVIKSPDTDYLFRAVLPRTRVAEAIASEVTAIDYGNFKDSVRNRPLHDAYSAVWGIMARLQPTRPYSGRGNGRQGGLL